MTEDNSLSKKVVSGGTWVFTLHIVSQLLHLIRTVILARLLVPHDFGLAGVAMLAISTLGAFTSTGFGAALIQKKGDINRYLNVAWTVQLFRSFVLAIILFFIAPSIATFFKEPQAGMILRVLVVTELFRGVANIGVIYFPKELEFHKEFWYRFIPTLIDFIVAVPVAFILRSVWALVFGSIAGGLATVIMGYIIHPYRPHLSFELSKAKELFNFGKWVFGSSILVFLITQGDDIFVAKLLGISALGFYLMAYRLSNMPATEITHVISRVTFPAYSKLQDNIPKLREGFLRTVEATASLSLPLTVGIFILAPDFIRLFLGEKWMPMVTALRILSISGLMRSIVATGVVFRGIGQPNLAFWMNLIRLVVIATFIYPLTVRYDINGTAIAVLLGIIAAIPFWWKASSRVVKYSTQKFLRYRLLPPIVGSILMAIVILISQSAFSRIGLVEFIGLIIIGVISYIASQLLSWKFYHLGLIRTLQTLRRPV